MFDITFVTDDKTKYTLTISYIFHDDPDDTGMELDIINISPVTSEKHSKEIYWLWTNRLNIYDKSLKMAYEDKESRCVK